MKKLAYLSVLAGLFLTGCIAGDYGIEPADPQVNEQDEIVNLAGTAAVTEVAAIDLAAVEGETVSVGTLAVSGLDSVKDIKYYVTFDETYQFSTTAGLELAVEDLQAMVEDAYGKRPAARTFEALVKVNAVINGTAMIFESEEFKVVLTPEAPFIDSAYYLIGGMNDWNADNAKNFKFSHSGKDVYEDPVFTITFTASDECWWKIIPQSNYDAGDIWIKGTKGVLGVATNGDDALEGKLTTAIDPATNDVGSGVIKAGAGMYVMTINMMDYTYSIKALAPEFYILGDSPFAWNVDNKTYLMYAESSKVMTYTTKFDGNIKFINSNDMGKGDWKAPYGAPADKNGSTDLDGVLFKGQPDVEAGAIHVPESGYYTFRADLESMTYSWTKIEEPAAVYKTIAVVGQFQGWNPSNEDTFMTEIAPHNWCLRDVEITTNEFKIAADGSWDPSWGGADFTESNSCVLPNKDNSKITPGKYDIYFNDITLHCSVVKK